MAWNPRPGRSGALVLALSLGCASHQAARTPTADGTCTAQQVEGAYRGGTSPATGEHSAWIDLVNVSTTSCTVQGYPDVQFLAGERVLPFHTNHHGMYLDAPNAGSGGGCRILLSPHDAAHFLIAKYRCDVGWRAGVTSLRIKVTGAPDRTSVALPTTEPGPGFDYCKAYNGAPDSTDPGNEVKAGGVLPGEVTQK